MSGESYCPECSAVFTGLPHQCKSTVRLTDEEMRAVDEAIHKDGKYYTIKDDWEATFFAQQFYNKAQFTNAAKGLREEGEDIQQAMRVGINAGGDSYQASKPYRKMGRTQQAYFLVADKIEQALLGEIE